MLLGGGKTCWMMSADQYVKEEVTNVEDILARYGRRLSL